MTNSDPRFSAASDHGKVADWLEDQARIATNSLHCGDNSGTIQQTHAWARKLEAAALHLRNDAQSVGMREALEGIRIYTSDTLSGRADGPDDREWQREAVVEVNRRARAALAASQPSPAATVETGVSYEAMDAALKMGRPGIERMVEAIAKQTGEKIDRHNGSSAGNAREMLTLASQIEAARDLHRNSISSDLRRRHSILMDLLAGNVDLILSALRNTTTEPQGARK